MNGHQGRFAALPLALLLVLLGLVFWLYYPGTTGPVLLDDHNSVGRLSGLAETPEQAWADFEAEMVSVYG